MGLVVALSEAGRSLRCANSSALETFLYPLFHLVYSTPWACVLIVAVLGGYSISGSSSSLGVEVLQSRSLGWRTLRFRNCAMPRFKLTPEATIAALGTRDEAVGDVSAGSTIAES